jgi:hypothetical protein
MTVRRPRRLWLATLAILAALTILTAAASCGGRDQGSRDPDLEALRAQDIATAEIAGTEQGATEEQESGTSLGKPRYARLGRKLPLQSNADPQTVLMAALTRARDDGWTPKGEPPPSSDFAWVLGKTVGQQHLQLSISVQPVDGRQTLIVSLANFR